MNIKFSITLFLCAFVSLFSQQKMQSPDGSLKLELSKSGQITGTYATNNLFKTSQIGLSVSGKKPSSFELQSQKEIKETWESVVGKNKTVLNHANEYRFQTNLGYTTVIRLYNDGFAYRYEFDKEANTAEISSFTFDNPFRYWHYVGEKPHGGPKKSGNGATATIPKKVATAAPAKGKKKKKKGKKGKSKGGNGAKIPLILESEGGYFAAFHEAAIIDFHYISLGLSGKTIAIKGSYGITSDRNKTSWRTILVGKEAKDIASSNILQNLNEPCKIEDPSWIKKGKSFWDWRTLGYKAKDGFTYGLNVETQKRFIDYAAANNIDYLLIDANWYGNEHDKSSNPLEGNSEVPVKESIAYANKKGIGVFLYLNDKGAKGFGLEKVLAFFEKMGAKGVKYGFMKGGGDQKVRYTRKVVELCAKYHLLVDFHDGPVPPSGDSRTWPNLIAKEFCHAQADSKKTSMPVEAVNNVFINGIAGELDVTDGYFDVKDAHKDRQKVFTPLAATIPAEVAKVYSIHTGLTVLPDAADAYAKEPRALPFITEYDANYSSYKVIDGTLDQYAVVVKSTGKKWFVGGVNNEKTKKITIDFSFLPKGKFRARVLKDAASAHYKTNPLDFEVEEITVTNTTKLPVKLAAGGGVAIIVE